MYSGYRKNPSNSLYGKSKSGGKFMDWDTLKLYGQESRAKLLSFARGRTTGVLPYSSNILMEYGLACIFRVIEARFKNVFFNLPLSSLFRLLLLER
jgi:hypothetical protein